MRLLALLTGRGLRRCLSLALLLGSLGTAHATQTVTYYHSNALGSPVAATDAAGNVLWREAYEPYGLRLIKDANSSGNSRYFTGHPEDSTTGLTYMGSRFYDPRVGRFLSPDPQRFTETNLASFNRYAYGNHNPYKYVDPDGEVPVLPIIYAVGKELVGMAVEHFTGIPASTKGILKAGAKKVAAKQVTKEAKDLKPKVIQENPRNLIPTQTKSDISSSRVKKFSKDMKQNGYDQSKPVDAWRNPNSGRLEIQDGHHRTDAAKKAGLDKIPVRVWE